MLAACAPSLPPGILSKDDMEDILYDMHIAQAMYDSREGGISDATDLVALRSSVLKKHEVEEAMWDSSFNYYCRNSRDMYEIYQSLDERVERNVVALGGKVAGRQDEDADTANVWNAEPSFLLTHQAPYNLYTFEIEPDSTFEDGDRITLQYDVQFIFQDGKRDVAAFLAVYYANDSVATKVEHTNHEGHGVLTIENTENRLHVKKIKGYFLLVQDLAQNSTNANTSSMRLAALRNVKLLHLRTMPPAPPKVEAPADSLAVDSLTLDSIRKDSIMKSHTTITN